jgi:predicted transcriptional regulator of viral defense system
MENYNLVVHGIISMPNLSPSEKLVMIQIASAKAIGMKRVNVQVSSDLLGYSRNGWRKVAMRLIEKGFINNPKRGYYELAETNIF